MLGIPNFFAAPELFVHQDAFDFTDFHQAAEFGPRKLFSHMSSENGGTRKNRVTMTDVFGRHNGCFSGSERCPIPSKEVRFNPFDEKYRQKVREFKESESIVYQGKYNGEKNLTYVRPTDGTVFFRRALHRDNTQFHPYFRFEKPIFGPTRVTVKEIAYIDENRVGFSRFSAERKIYPQVYNWDQVFMVGQITTTELGKALYQTRIRPTREQGAGISTQLLQQHADNVLDIGDIQHREGHKFFLRHELNLRTKLDAQTPLDEEDKDVLDAFVKQYFEDKNLLETLYWPLSVGGKLKASQEEINAEIVQPIWQYRKSLKGLGAFAIPEWEYTGFAPSADTENPDPNATATEPPARFRLQRIDTQIPVSLENPNDFQPGTGEDMSDLSREHTVSLYFLPTKLLPADLPAIPFARSGRDNDKPNIKFSPLCPNGVGKRKVFELTVKTLHDKAIVAHAKDGRDQDWALHQTTKMSGNQMGKDCYCDGLFPTCSAPGWLPSAPVMWTPEEIKAMKRDVRVKTPRTHEPSGMKREKLSSIFLDITNRHSKTATPFASSTPLSYSTESPSISGFHSHSTSFLRGYATASSSSKSTGGRSFHANQASHNANQVSHGDARSFLSSIMSRVSNFGEVYGVASLHSNSDPQNTFDHQSRSKTSFTSYTSAHEEANTSVKNNKLADNVTPQPVNGEFLPGDVSGAPPGDGQSPDAEALIRADDASDNGVVSNPIARLPKHLDTDEYGNVVIPNGFKPLFPGKNSDGSMPSGEGTTRGEKMSFDFFEDHVGVGVDPRMLVPKTFPVIRTDHFPRGPINPIGLVIDPELIKIEKVQTPEMHDSGLEPGSDQQGGPIGGSGIILTPALAHARKNYAEENDLREDILLHPQ